MVQVKDGKFLGLPLDEDNEDDQTDDRIAAWGGAVEGRGHAAVNQKLQT